MIVKDNSKQYKQFFDKLNIALGYKGDKEISDINDYFMELYNIKEGVVNGTVGFDPYMLILPNENDEPIFTIDANTRQITVPPAFNAGVGVQGDDLAEVIYFSIDRYFDTTDLYDKEIFIQWEAPSGDRGLSIAINKTLNLLPNKVVFGWAISKEMTTKAGAIKFAIRFYEREAQGEAPKLIYSFSTLTSTVKINPALDFDIDTEDDVNAIGAIDKSALIYKMMRNSSASGLDAKAVAPTIDETDCTPDFAPAEFDVGQKFEGRARFGEEDSADGYGTISYSWYRSLNDNYKDSILIEASPALEYKPIDGKETKKIYETYYIENNGQYEVYNGTIPNSDGITIYKRYTSYIPDKAGYYYFVAKNSAGRGNENKTNSSNWLIAFAKKANVDCSELLHTIMVDSQATLNPSISVEDDGVLTYQWYKGETSDGDYSAINEATSPTLNVNEEGYYFIKVINSKNNDTTETIGDKMRVTTPAGEFTAPTTWLYYVNGSIKPNRFATIGSVIKVELQEQPQKSDNISYQWYYSPTGPEEDSYILLPGKTSKEYVVEQAGAYRVKITNTYNLNTKEADSEYFTVMS